VFADTFDKGKRAAGVEPGASPPRDPRPPEAFWHLVFFGAQLQLEKKKPSEFE